jgi:choline dehydrogenase
MRVVIVGGGSAGLFAALALAGWAEVTVVEAGADPGSPAPDHYLHDHLYPDCDWSYAEADRGYHLVRGKVLGGSSTVNAAAAVRGQPSCFDSWGDGWRWDDVLPAFRAIERDEQFGDRPWHGDAGPVTVTRLEGGPLDEAFADACRRIGHPSCADHNAPGSLGVGPWPTNRVNGGRWGTLAAVAPQLRGAVQIRSGVEVRRILLDGHRAVGVELAGPAGSERIDADLVIVSAGTFGSPELLWRSGIAVAGVGEGLADHPWVTLDAEADATALAARPVSGGLLRFAPAGDADAEIQVFPFSAALYEPALPASTYRMSVAAMAPRSIGCMAPGKRASAVRLGHLLDHADVDVMEEGLRHAADLLDEMASSGAVRLPEKPWWRRRDLRGQLRARVTTYNHPVGTCAIGRVVDATLRVNGYDALRIADASVMPVIPKANTNLAAMMIGWRAAQLVIDEMR